MAKEKEDTLAKEKEDTLAKKKEDTMAKENEVGVLAGDNNEMLLSQHLFIAAFVCAL
eukprot:CAMPEP_0172434268 /NCGR_PEP_ID=MMETSP1064-20121228/70542_1 /TAXON_ID=202472 /ORGANISM="Aulacoseira subarctica , Strain CCAP 1002/5" /LENGTH=56 /DNA_ID=CAMNT_0013182475 /DNA_START=1045 /DNA_END=1215 /DNA_ORIENTATION=-